MGFGKQELYFIYFYITPSCIVERASHIIGMSIKFTLYQIFWIQIENMVFIFLPKNYVHIHTEL